MANHFKVAHIREQGVDLIIIPLDSQFRFKPDADQQQTIAVLQACATSAGLQGTVVPVWDNGGGRMAFRAPQNWHPFFQGISLGFVAANINRELTCG
jgi:hypothetical protein